MNTNPPNDNFILMELNLYNHEPNQIKLRIDFVLLYLCEYLRPKSIFSLHFCSFSISHLFFYFFL